MRKLEEDRRRREAEIIEFQRQHFQEMKEAAARNRKQILGGEPARPRSRQSDEGSGQAADKRRAPTPPRTPPGGHANEDAQDLEFAAMVKDMQDVLEGGERDNDCDDPDDLLGEDTHHMALAGKFMLNGEMLRLPVREEDSLALKVEALRCFLEERLGTDPFLRVYRRLESLTQDDDDEAVSREFVSALGPEKLAYLQLVHQLIICEENMHTGPL